MSAARKAELLTTLAHHHAQLARTYGALAQLEGTPPGLPANEEESGSLEPAPVSGPRVPVKLSRQEIAEAFRRSAITIDRWVAAGMPCEEMGSFRLFSLRDCQAWAAARPKRERPVKRPPRAQAEPTYTLRTRKKAG